MSVSDPLTVLPGGINKPLAGVRVLDLTHMLSGPYGTMVLADLGAEIIKVEPPGGEPTRNLLAEDPENSIDGMGAYFITLNRNKRSVCIDLKQQRGLEIFYDLVGKADIVFDNFSAGVTRRLKIDYEALSAVNQRIITVSVTGFGADGPGCKRPAFDQIVQAMGGGMSITGSDPGSQTRAGIPIGDLAGGLFGVIGLLSALYECQRSGRGQHVDISMLDCQISLLNYMATMHFLNGKDPEPMGNSHFVHVPYNSYSTSDGAIIIAVIFDSFWDSLVEMLDHEPFRQEQLRHQPGRLKAKQFIDSELAAIFRQKNSAEWLAQLRSRRIPCAPINRFSDALNDEQVRFRNMVVELLHPDGGSTMGPGNPVKLSRNSEESFGAAPLTGADTKAILSSLLGYDDDTIGKLCEMEVIS